VQSIPMRVLVIVDKELKVTNVYMTMYIVTCL